MRAPHVPRPVRTTPPLQSALPSRLSVLFFFLRGLTQRSLSHYCSLSVLPEISFLLFQTFPPGSEIFGGSGPRLHIFAACMHGFPSLFLKVVSRETGLKYLFDLLFDPLVRSKACFFWPSGFMGLLVFFPSPPFFSEWDERSLGFASLRYCNRVFS